MHESSLSHDLNFSSSVAISLPSLPSNLSTSAPTGSRLHPPDYRLNPPTRRSPSPNPNPVFSAARLPRTSSLLPPPRIAPASQPGPPTAPRDHPSPAADHVRRPQTPPRHFNNSADISWNLNRWSASTGSSHASVFTQRQPTSRFARRASTDATALLNRSPPSNRQSPRKLQKGRRPSSSSISRIEGTFANTPPSEVNNVSLGLPPIVSLPPLDSLIPNEHPYHRLGPQTDSTRRLSSHTRWESQPFLTTSVETLSASYNTPLERPTSAANSRPAMQNDQGPEAHAPRGHSRGRSGKGSNDSKGRGSKPPSQKAMLSRALQKANTAVQLDNAQNFEGARQAYAEACNLLQQVLQRTSADEDQRKLDAIRRTYTSRIDELDQMAPWQEEMDKALPARPNSDIHRPDSVLRLDDKDQVEEVAVVETATVTRVIRDDSRSPQPPPVNHPTATQRYQELRHRRESSQDKLRPIVTTTLTVDHGLLQSSFSRSPVRLRAAPENLTLQRPGDHPYIPAPLSPRRPLSPVKPEVDEFDEPVRSDFSLSVPPSLEPRETANHAREESLNSWLDPIDESGGSASSSVHSRTSSLGIRRKHIRAPSGETEAEFDTALDAAIEAAYDEGYEPMDEDEFGPEEPDEEIIANAMRKVEIARERVRQTEREVQEFTSEIERQRDYQQPEYPGSPNMPDFYDDNSSDEEERMLEEMREYAIEHFAMEQGQKPSIPRESDSSGITSRTWHSSMGSNPPTAATSLATVTEMRPFSSMSPPSAPAAPPPTQSLPELPPTRPSSSSQSVRNRRLSGQNPKQLKIETAKLGAALPINAEVPTQIRSATTNGQESDIGSATAPRSMSAQRRPPSPFSEISPSDMRSGPSPFGHLNAIEGEDSAAGRSASPSTTKLRKNFSSSSLRSMKGRNMSISNLDEGSDMSPGTPSSNHFGALRAPVVPTVPTPMTAAFRERADTTTGGFTLFDDTILSPNDPGSPNPLSPEAPMPLEPCPTDFMLRPFWLMRCLYQTLAHPRGGYLSTKLFVPRDVWRVKGVKLKNIDEKVANCDFLTAALLKIAKVDTYDADAVLEEMQSLEGILEQVQAALSRKLGNEVGVQSSGMLFKEASGAADGDGSAGVPRSTSVTAKSSSFSWRRLRSKNSAVGLGGAYNSRFGGHDAVKDVPSIPTLPMTPNPTSRPAKRDVGQVQFTGPNAMYMNALARLFDAAQAIDQIARQVEDPGLRHADKTQVGLELCTRHAAEFFGFYICRFVLADLGILLDKFIKRGSEWVLT
ncbi:hypothetical protein G7046_g5661 [Stylonectria norvegica]|nr:hypothetical protein G7046_g5661 [Stylonectria norvegica]